VLIESDRLTRPVGEVDHVRGPATAPVTIVEYGDYQCPFCKAAEPLVEALVQALGNNLRIVFRHFPITRAHAFAERAAEAAEAAGAQGQYWPMHRTLFAHQDALNDDSLLGYARSLGLDLTSFEAAMTQHAYRGKVRADMLGGLQSGARGTPTFFIDSARYDGPPDLRDMLALIRQRHAGLDNSITEVTVNIRVPAMTPHEGEAQP
jgi:protein-disulfide isomerase